MVERLKDAIEKARGLRSGATAPAAGQVIHRAAVEASDSNMTPRWMALAEIAPSPQRLASKRIVALDKNAPEHAPFDVLRTRLLSAMREHKWRTVAITSPSKGCGKSTVCLNLAFSLARQPDTRTLVVDFDMRAPALATILGVDHAPSLNDLIAGRTDAASHLLRFGDNLAFALNGRRIENSAELLQGQRAATLLDDMIAAYKPDIVLMDTCPMLVSDDVISMLPLTDAVLMVAAGGLSKAHEIVECERLIEGRSHFLGVVLNRSENVGLASYASQYNAS